MDIPVDCCTELPLGNLLLTVVNPRARLGREGAFQLALTCFYQKYGSLKPLVRVVLDLYALPHSREAGALLRQGCQRFLTQLLQCQYCQENDWKH